MNKNQISWLVIALIAALAFSNRILDSRITELEQRIEAME